RPAVSKNSSTALSSHEGAFATSTTTRAPVSASANPSPVTALTPVEGEAATTLCPRSPRSVTSFFPMSPLPPITTIFMLSLLACRPASGAIIRLPPPTSGTACPGSGSWTPPRARPGCAASLLLLRDDDVLGVVRVKHNSDHPRRVLVAGVLRDPVQASGRLVERILCLQLLDGFVVDGPLVLALQDVADRRAGVAVRRAGLARPQGHLDRRCLRLPPVDLFGDVDSRVIAFDKASGDVKWQQLLPDTGFGHSTPVIIQVKGKPQMLVLASGMSVTGNALQSLDPANGKRLWWCRGA